MTGKASATVERDTGTELDALEALTADEFDADDSGGDQRGGDTVAVGEDPQSAPTRRRRLQLRAAVGAAAALIIGLGGLSGYLGWQYHDVRAVQAAAEQARQAAESYAVTLTSIDTRDLDANFDAVLDGATGEFREIYRPRAPNCANCSSTIRPPGAGWCSTRRSNRPARTR